MRSASLRTLIKGGHIVSMDPAIGNLDSGDILITGSRITAVGRDLDVEHDDVLDATGCYVIPGLINTHVHLWETPLRGLSGSLWSKEYHRAVFPLSIGVDPETARGASFVGAWEQLSAGVTTTLDHSHVLHSAEHTDAAIEGAREAGIRLILGYSLLRTDGTQFGSKAEQRKDLERVVRQWGDDSLISIALAVDKFDLDDLAYGAERNLTVTIHANPPGLITQAQRAGLLGKRQLWVHANQATDFELDLLAEADSSLSLAPDIEVGMGKPLSIFRRSRSRGVRVVYGVDSPSYVANDVLSQLRLAHQVHRLLDGMAEREDGHIPPWRHDDLPLVDATALLHSATLGAAESLGLGSTLGSLTPGKTADIAVMDAPFGMSLGHPAEHIVLQSSQASASSVMVGGQFKKRSGKLVGATQDGVRQRFAEARSRLIQTDVAAFYRTRMALLKTDEPFGAAVVPAGIGTPAAGGMSPP